MRCIVCDLCDLVTEDIGCVWLDVKYFPKRKIFSSVWLYSRKYFGKYFLVFGCILENALENPFLSCFSHFLTFSQLPNRYIIKSNKTQILNTQQKKKKKSSNQRSTQNQRTTKQEPLMPPQQQQENQRSKKASGSAMRST